MCNMCWSFDERNGKPLPNSDLRLAWLYRNSERAVATKWDGQFPQRAEDD